MPEWTIKPGSEDSSTLAPPAAPAPSPDGSHVHQAPRRRKWLWIVGVVLVLLVAVLIYRQHSASQEESAAKQNQASRAVPVVTAKASQGDMGVYVEALGTVTPVYTVTVTSRVQGQIMQVYYKEGQIVRKGDPLLDIDPRPYQAALTQAQGQLAHDSAMLAEARTDLDRYRTAFSKNAIAEQQVFDQQQTVQQDEGTVQNDQGVLDNAQVNLVYCHITSPIDGRVGLRLVDPGNIVQANSTTSLVVVTQLQPITVIFSVAEDYLAQIEKQLRGGQKMKVDALDRAQSKTVATGSLLTLDNQVDTTTGTVKLRAIFDNRDNALFPNEFVNAKLLLDMQHNVVLIPTPAIQRNSQQGFVYVIGSDQTAKIRNITAGASDNNVTAVQGVKAGEVIAVDGFDKLQDGIKVQPRSNNAKGRGQQNQSDSNSSSTDQAP
jgi:membrane fusion protein, multidrug efflux system